LGQVQAESEAEEESFDNTWYSAEDSFGIAPLN
jgi:hypothetical protein